MKRILSFLLITLLFATTTAKAASYVQAIWTAKNKTLTFHYGALYSKDGTYNGQTISAVWTGTAVTSTGTSLPGWVNSVKGTMTTVVFEASFKNVQPTSCYGWFSGCTKLTTITNIGNLTTTNVTNMASMFNGCTGLTALNLSTFNTAKVKNMSSMFNGCTKLKTLNLSGFTTSSVTQYSDIFNSVPAQCFVFMPTGTLAAIKSLRSKNLVLNDGSAWTCANCEMNLNTEYSISYKFTATALAVKNSSSTVNLLYRNGSYYSTVSSTKNVVLPAGTDKFVLPTAQAIWTEDNSTLTFTYAVPYSVGGTYGGQTITNVWSGEAVTATGTNLPGWNTIKASCTTVKFDPSFKNVKPTSLYYWFGYFKTLTSITGIANLNTASVTNMAATFMWCNSLTSLDVSGFQTSNVTSMHDMFCECGKLTSIDVSKFNTAKVTNMAGMFENCASFTSINVSSFNTAKVTNMQGMFNGCSSLTSLDVSNFNTANVTTMGFEDPVHYNDEEYGGGTQRWYYGGMFQNCSKLTSLNLGNFNTAKVTDLDQMFYGCTSLTSIDLNQMSSASATQYSDMFYNVPAQCFVYIPTGVAAGIKSQRSKNLVLKDGSTWTSPNFEMTVDKEYVISYQFKTTTLTVSGSSATTHYLYKDGIFNSTLTSLANVTIPKGKDKITASALAQAIWTAGNSTLTFVPGYSYAAGGTYGGQAITNVWNVPTSSTTPEWLSTVKGSMTKAVFVSSFKNLKPTTCYSWFKDCTKLTTITGIANLTTTNVTNMHDMFYNCSALTSLDVSPFNTANVTVMWGMFSNCSKLTSLNLSNFNTAKVTDMDAMFSGCTSLKDLDLSNFNTSSVTTSSQMFNNVPTQCFVYMPTGTLAGIKSQRSKNLVLKNGSSWTCASCEVNVNTEYAVLYKFTASSLTVKNASSTTYHLYNNGTLNSTVGISNVIIPAGTDKFAEVTVQAIWTEGNKTLTFYYGEAVSVGGTYGGQTVTNVWSGTAVTATGTSTPGWVNTVKGTMTTVKFDASFKNMKPTSCYCWFADCSKLTTITGIANLTTTNVTNMEQMFSNCSSLTSLDVSKFNTANVTTMKYMFRGLSSVSSLDLSSFSTANVTIMWGMFSNCSKLTSLNLSNFNTAKVTDMDAMFSNCTSLKNLELSSLNTSSIQYSSNVFSSVPAQCFVYMPTGVTDKIKSQRSKNLVLKNGSAWTCANCEMTPDTEYDIWYQFKATTLTVSGSSATAFCLYKDGAMYSTVTSFANVTIPKGKDKISETFPAMAIWTAGNTTLTFLMAENYKVGDTYNGQTITNVWKGSAITASANTPAWLSTVKGTVTKVVFDASFKYVKPTKCLNWFYQCGKLATITGIGNLNTSEVTTMQQMFRECLALTSLNLSTFDTQKVTTTRCMFYGCTGLTSLNLSSFNTTATTNMGYMFCNCSKLTSIDVSKFNTANVTAMEGLFYGCAGVTSLDLTKFHTTKVTTMKDMFRGCSKLASIDASNFTSDALTTYTGMFNDVPELCFVYMRAGMPDDLKSQKAKNLVLKDGNTWTCDNCWMTFNKTYDILYDFTATSFTADGINATNVALYNDDVPFAAIYNFANESIPKGADRLSDYSGPQVVWTAGNTTLTFTSSENLYAPGDTFNGETVTDVWISFNTEEISTPKWLSTLQGALTHVVFDNSFASYLPPSCSRWFKDCGQLTTVSGWENLQTSECISFFEMFKNCEKLESVDVSHFDTSKCTRFQDMFQRCSSLTTIDVSNFDTSKAWSIGGMFAYCPGLTELDLSSFNTEKVTDFGWLVRGCTNLRSLDLSNFNTAKQYGNQYFFENVSDQCFIFIPEGQWEKFNQAKTDNLVLKKSDGTFECDNCVLTDGETLTLPHSFTAKGGVKYERTIPANTSEASAVFLPYNSMIPEGVTAYTLKTSEQKHLSKDKVMFEPVNGTVMEAYTPYLIINRGADLTDLNTTTDTQVLPTTTAPAEKSFGDLRFTGTVQTLSNEEAVAMQAYSMQDGNQWKKVTASSAEGIPAYRAFLVSPSFSASTLKAVFPLPGDANDDGNVTVTDIAVVVNEILQLPNTDISTDNADANSDGQITVTDIGVIVDMILGNTAASSRKLQGLEPQ